MNTHTERTHRVSMSFGPPPRATRHTHEDTALTFGCDACIADAEAARVTNAPVRACTWHVAYAHGQGEDFHWATLTFSLDLRVPDGWDTDQVDAYYASETGEAFVMALPHSVRMADTDWACDTMEVEKVVIGPVVEQVNPLAGEQGSLL